MKLPGEILLKKTYILTDKSDIAELFEYGNQDFY